MRGLTVLVALGGLVGHDVRLRIFNRELRGLTVLAAAIPPHADVRGLVGDTDPVSESFGNVLSQAAGWVTGS